MSWHPTLDLTEPGEPTFEALIRCPGCEHVTRCEEVTCEFEEDFDCEGCGKPLHVMIKIGVEFGVTCFKDQAAADKAAKERRGIKDGKVKAREAVKRKRAKAKKSKPARA